MDKLKYFRNVLWIGIPSMLVWGWLCQHFNPGCYDSIAIRMNVTILGVIVLAGSYAFEFFKKNIEYLTYIALVAVFIYYVYMCTFDPKPEIKFIHITGLLAIGSIFTIAIVSRRFLYLWSFGVSIYALVEAILYYGDSRYFLFWLNMLTVIGLMGFFSLQRIKGIEKVEEARAEDKRKSDEIRLLYEMAAQAAHDIRSPVTALEMVYKTLDENAPVRDLVKGSMQRINSIADNMLRVHRRHSVAPADQRPGVDVSALFEELQAETQLLHPSVRVRTDVSAGVAQCKTISASDLYRIISNLINNSIEAGATTVQLCAQCDGNCITIRVRDNGRGIHIDNQSNLFKRGFTFGKQSGNGLGLYGARQLLNSVDGDISLTSKPGVGTEVKVWYPVGSLKYSKAILDN